MEQYDKLGMTIIKEGKIDWNTLNKFIELLSKDEEINIREEYLKRDKQEKIIKNRIEKNMEEMPLMERTFELYIDPFNKGWEERYYETLFEGTKDIKRINDNYLQTLEWCFNYYTKGCVDWDWKYEYHYPPLLKDLKTHITYKKEISEKREWTNEKVLEYILPNKYNGKYEIQWCYCRYLWESHIYL
jgi:5'-3' exonuclease